MGAKKIILFLFLLGASFLQGQTPGLNYQAVILNTSEIEIPGTNVKENQVPLGLEDITFRFSISNKNNIEYIEEQTVTTDASGMVSLIVGEGTPISATFNDIVWDGEEKYLNVEIDILSNNDGFIFLDAQKILYIPPPIRNNTTTTEQFVITAVDGQLFFTTPLPITNIQKIDVYRNGARISFTQINGTTIQIDKEATCYQGDEIRIVQLK
tara:strand:+ start:534 stop:1166 length:633 start_codon:yes stop_codon:yes gene_type:complete